MKHLILQIIVLYLISPVFSQDVPMIDQIRKHDTGIGIWWAGHNTWIIKSDGLVIATDIFLENNGRIAPVPVTAEELASVLDISFVTHGHDDHFNQKNSKVLLEKSDCLFVLPESCLGVAEKIGIPYSRIRVAKPREPFEIKGIEVSPLRALHGHINFSIYYEANMQDCGYLFKIGDKTIFQPGDSYLLQDHFMLGKVNVLFFSPTEHNTYIEPSVLMINALEPDFILPQHHSTMVVNEKNRFWTKGYPDEVKIRLARPLREKYHILAPGEKIVVN